MSTSPSSSKLASPAQPVSTPGPFWPAGDRPPASIPKPDPRRPPFFYSTTHPESTPLPPAVQL